MKREIERIHKFERAWNIKTSQNKFKILSISATKPENITIDARQIPFANSINILGFTMTRTGFNKHVKDKTRKARIELQKTKKI